jgi:hypothetical protein
MAEQATYVATTGFFTPPATPTDLAGLVNTTDGATLKLARMTLSASQNTGGLNTFFLLIRNSQNQGGTPVNATIVPLDLNNLDPDPWVISYSANPTVLGGLVGIGAEKNVFTPGTQSQGPGSGNDPADVTLFDDSYKGQPVTLRINEGIYLNFGGAAVPTGLKICVNFLFTRS